MVNIMINSNCDIDYSVLANRMKRSESTTPNLVGKELIMKFLQSDTLTDEQKEYVVRLFKRQKSQEKYSYPYQRTKTGTITHNHEFIFKNGISQQVGYDLIKIDLIPCILQLIQIISGIKGQLNNYSINELKHYADDIADLISGTMEGDESTQELITNLVNINNPYLNMYISKAISLTEQKNITVMDAFGIERLYRSLFPIEAIIIPLSYSLYSLQYILVERLRDLYKRGEKRFACIDKHRIYYFVRKDLTDKFMDTNLYLNDIKLNVTLDIIKPKLQEVLV